MKKSFIKFGTYYGKGAKFVCNIEDVSGYISITGEIYQGCKKDPVCAGCIHEEIAKHFPEFRDFIWLHLVNLDGSVMYEVENSLYFLANDDIEIAKNYLHCTDDEINDLYNLVSFGLHRTKTSWPYKDNETGYQITDESSVKTYETALNKLGLKNRRLNAIKDFYGVLSGMH